MISKGLKNIDMDFIRELRIKGMYYEASQLLDSYIECGKKNIQEGKKINNRLYEKERKIRYKYQKRCITCGKQDEITKNGKSRCKSCLNRYKVYNKLRKGDDKK